MEQNSKNVIGVADSSSENQKGGFCHIAYVWTSVIVLYKDATIANGSLLLNHCTEICVVIEYLMYFLNVIDRFVVFKKFIMNDSFPIPHVGRRNAIQRKKNINLISCFIRDVAYFVRLGDSLGRFSLT